MDFFLYEPALGVETGLHFPLDPERTRTRSESNAQQFTPLEGGPVRFPRGNQPARISFQSMFPGEGRQGEPWAKDWRHPLEYVAVIRQWQANNTPVTLLVTESEITGWDVFVESIETEISGGWGDVPFTIEFSTLKPVRLLTEAEQAAEAAAALTGALGEATAPPAATHVVVEGESLWEIARKEYGDGTLWESIYAANAELIGPDWDAIFPGMELVLP